jgi:hypothetical protein
LAFGRVLEGYEELEIPHDATLKEDGQDEEPVQEADPDLEALQDELDNAKESGFSLLRLDNTSC